MIVTLIPEAYTLITLTLLAISTKTIRQTFFSIPRVFTHEHTHQRVPIIDYMRGIAILSVILIHIIYLYQYGNLAGELTPFMKVVNNIFRFAVPIFFITSGILLTPIQLTRSHILQFYLKKTYTLLLPYFLCALAVAQYQHTPLLTAIGDFFTGQLAVPFWFVPVLFQFYLLYPFLNHWRKQPWFLPITFTLSLASYLLRDTWYVGNLPLCFQYLFLFSFGLAHRETFLTFDRRMALPAALTVVATYIAAQFIFLGYYFNAQLFYGPAMFILFILFQQRILSWPCTETIKKIGANSLWIFLTHLVICELCYLLLQKTIPIGWLQVCLVTVSSMVGSVLFATICRYVFTRVFQPINSSSNRFNSSRE